MSTYALLQAAAIGGNLFVLGIVFGRWRTTAVHRAFLLFLAASLGWASFTLFFALPASEGHEMLAKRLAAVFWIPLNFWILRFMYLLLERKRDLLYYLFAALTAAAAVLYVGTDLALAGYERHDWGVAAVRGPLHLPISLLVAVTGLTALVHMALGWKRANTPLQARSLAVLTIGCGLTYVAVFSANLVLPVFVGLHGFPELGSYGVFLISPFLYLAVMRYDFLRLDAHQVAQQLFETTKDGILLVDTEGMIRQSNYAARVLLANDDPIGRPLRDVVGATLRPQAGTEQLTLGQGESLRTIEVTRSKATHPEAGEVVVLRDVTAQRLAESVLRKSHDELSRQVQQRTEELDQAQKMEAIGTIAGGFAHDFNNILAAVVGFATAAKSDLPEDHPVQRDLDDILMASSRGTGIVRQLMSITRRRKAHRTVVDGAACVAEVVRLAKASAPGNVSVRFEQAATHAVRADPARLTQVLLNMATNAFHAMGRKGGTLTFEVDLTQLAFELELGDREQLPAGRYLQITVRDDGPGMQPEVAKRAFEPFFTTKEEDGTGLGLATAHRIVKEHGGAITLNTAPGQGCTLRVLLPCAEGEVRDEVADHAPVPKGTERIVVVDDAEQVVRAVRRMLEPLGYRIRGFTDPREALCAVKEAPGEVDMVITDLSMPEMTGVELSEALLSLRPDLPILLVTGHDTYRGRGLAESTRIRSVLFKPLDPAALARAVRQQIDSPPPTQRP